MQTHDTGSSASGNENTEVADIEALLDEMKYADMHACKNAVKDLPKAVNSRRELHLTPSGTSGVSQTSTSATVLQNLHIPRLSRRQRNKVASFDIFEDDCERDESAATPHHITKNDLPLENMATQSLIAVVGNENSVAASRQETNLSMLHTPPRRIRSPYLGPTIPAGPRPSIFGD